MHEMSLAVDIIESVEKTARDAGAERVLRVTLTIGDGRDVVNDLFYSAFSYLAEGTLVEGAELVVNWIPYLVQCRICGTTHRRKNLDWNSWPCPQCGSSDCALKSGMEFLIESIEVE